MEKLDLGGDVAEEEEWNKKQNNLLKFENSILQTGNEIEENESFTKNESDSDGSTEDKVMPENKERKPRSTSRLGIANEQNTLKISSTKPSVPKDRVEMKIEETRRRPATLSHGNDNNSCIPVKKNSSKHQLAKSSPNIKNVENGDNFEVEEKIKSRNIISRSFIHSNSNSGSSINNANLLKKKTFPNKLISVLRKDDGKRQLRSRSLDSLPHFVNVDELVIAPPNIPKVDSPQSALVKLTSPWNLEPFSVSESDNPALYNWPLQYMEFDSTFYISEFFEKHHDNYFATDRNVGNVIISIRKDRALDQFLLIFRSKKGDVKLECPLSKKKISSKNFIRETASAYSLTLTSLKPIHNPKMEDLLVKYEKSGIFRRHKFGVLLVCKGQTHDDQFFSNQEGSEVWEAFLETLGKKVELKGFSQYRGGLDISDENNTGKYSYFQQYCPLDDITYEIMFHVSTLLPFNPCDPQQVERKRHLGNDVVNIIFIDSDEVNDIFDPSTIITNFIHVYIIVKVQSYDKDNINNTELRVEVITQDGVGEFGPPLPNPPIFNFKQFQQWIHPKLINAERAAFLAPAFKFKFSNTRKELINDIVEKFC